MHCCNYGLQAQHVAMTDCIAVPRQRSSQMIIPSGLAAALYLRNSTLSEHSYTSAAPKLVSCHSSERAMAQNMQQHCALQHEVPP